jgi:putative restriction endonuclease
MWSGYGTFLLGVAAGKRGASQLSSAQPASEVLMLKGFIGNTDHAWFEHLRARAQDAVPRGVLPEVNFWKPSARTFAAVPEGAPYFFRLKAPRSRIGGFGIFTRYVALPDWLAWDAFREGNGASDERGFVSLLNRYRAAAGGEGLHRVGCTLLTQAVFLPDELHISSPEDWSANIVSGKGVDLTEGEGLRIWTQAQAAARMLGQGVSTSVSVQDGDSGPRYGKPQWVAPRLGQGTFRVAVMEAYDRACAVTTEHSLPVLEAAHIRPYAAGGPHETSNGLFLRRDLHALFDLGYLTVSDDRRLTLSPRLRADYGNGKAYEAMHGTRLHLPNRAAWHPAPEHLRWHQDRVFRG